MKKFTITQYAPSFLNLPKAFDNFTIAHVADLHNADFGGQLEEAIAQHKPDMVAITGDVINYQNHDANAIRFVESAKKHAPVYYVNGNHEGRFKRYEDFKQSLLEAGAVALENEVFSIKKDGQILTLLGVNDHKFFKKVAGGSKKEAFKKMLQTLVSTVKDSDFKILLTHRPEFFEFYVSSQIDLTLSGHAHGGQIILPLLGALYAPGQGLFPKHAEGLLEKDGKYMVASRGLGQTVFTPPRIGNKRELIFVRLRCKLNT